MITQKYTNVISNQTRRNSSVIFVVEQLSRYLETILLLEDIVDSENLDSKNRYLIPNSVNQYFEIMRSMSEFMNPDLSTQIYGDDKKFLHLRYFEIIDSSEIVNQIPSTEKDRLQILVLFSQDLHFGRQWALLEKINNDPNSTVIYVDSEQSKFDFISNQDSRSELMVEVDTVAQLNKSLVPVLEADSMQEDQVDQGSMQEEEEGSDKDALTDTLSTKFPSILGALNDIKGEDPLEGEEEGEEIFGTNHGFFFFALKLQNKGSSSYGRAADEWLLHSIRNVNKISNFLPKKDPDNTLQAPGYKIDFLDQLVEKESSQTQFQWVNQPTYLEIQGISEGYSMEIILRNIRANVVVLINGDSGENEKVLAADLEKKKVRALHAEKKTYKGFLSRSQFKSAFADNMPENLNFRNIRSKDISYADVQIQLEVEFDKKKNHDLQITSKNSRISLLDPEKISKQNMLQLTHHNHTGNQSEQLVEYSSLDKFRLIEFKQVLEEDGIVSHLEFGRLNISNKVYVTQNKGQLCIDGIFCEEYYRVRKILYRMMMILNK